MSDVNEPTFGRDIPLSPADQRLLDRLAEAGFDAAAIHGLTADEQARLRCLQAALGLLKDYPVEEPDPALLDATMARIELEESRRAARMNLGAHQEMNAAGNRSFRFRVPDFISVAAVLLIGFAIMWPVSHSYRARALDAQCANNMRIVGFGLDHYAGDNDGSLPMARAGVAGTWDTVKNFLNLEPLQQGGYCEHQHLNCPGHAGEGPSYSYQWQLPGRSVRLHSGPAVLLLGDRNPVMDAARVGRELSPMSVSVNHAGRGQNVLSSDLATMWLDEPVIGTRDNIWLPNGVDRLDRGAMPASEKDVFLAH